MAHGFFLNQFNLERLIRINYSTHIAPIPKVSEAFEFLVFFFFAKNIYINWMAFEWREWHYYCSNSFSRLDILHNPRYEVGDACVDTRILTLTASNTPWYDANLCIMMAFVHHQRSARVSRAWITGRLTSTNHPEMDLNSFLFVSYSEE